MLRQRQPLFPTKLFMLTLLLGSCQGFSTATASRNSIVHRPGDTNNWSESAVVLGNCQATPHLWTPLVPKLWEPSRGFDSIRRWALREPVDRVMMDWVQEAFPTLSSGTKEQMAMELTRSAQSFVDAVTEQGPAKAFKARIVCSRGSAATKCPQWHIDHVPVRHVQSLLGPGCEYVDAKDVSWDRMNALSNAMDHLSTQERNDLLVSRGSRVHRAREGFAMLLVGNGWEKFAGYHLAACVHRSPHDLQPWEGRVLLTIDIDRDAS